MAIDLPSTLPEIRDALLARSLTAAELVRGCLERIERLNPALNALTQVFHDDALARADELDRLINRHGAAGLPLLGAPVVLKDNICLDSSYGDGRTTCASRFLEDYRSPFTATAAQRLIDSGAIVLGKANLDEFAMGSSTEHSIFGPTRNPFDPTRVCGGSSGGSACAVAADMCVASLGSDTGGSIRQPAGWCNVFALKPTYGRVSRYGLVAYASSLDQIGPFARTVVDAALVACVISGHDPLDSTSAPAPPLDATGLIAELERPIDKLVLGVPSQARSAANHPAVSAALDDAVRVFTRLGAVVIDIDLPHAEHAIAAYYIIATAEASSNLARFDGVRYGRRAEIGPSEDLFALYARSRAEGFGPEVQRRIMLGTHVLSSGYYDAYYNTALKARRLIKQDYDHAFEHAQPPCHAVLMPTSPGPAFRLGERSSDPMAMYLEDVYTVGVNLAGLPALTIPAGFAVSDGVRLPVGLQLIGP
ncbi:MAG: Asp-tRNA(Asn)/Glu-tRNA(Gln) amidotransferase subunit GatA, partial [Phycisphaerales bacterium]